MTGSSSFGPSVGAVSDFFFCAVGFVTRLFMPITFRQLGAPHKHSVISCT